MGPCFNPSACPEASPFLISYTGKVFIPHLDLWQSASRAGSVCLPGRLVLKLSSCSPRWLGTLLLAARLPFHSSCSFTPPPVVRGPGAAFGPGPSLQRAGPYSLDKSSCTGLELTAADSREELRAHSSEALSQGQRGTGLGT